MGLGQLINNTDDFLFLMNIPPLFLFVTPKLSQVCLRVHGPQDQRPEELLVQRPMQQDARVCVQALCLEVQDVHGEAVEK